MIELSNLIVFVPAVLVLLLSPGPNMALVLSIGLAHGACGGFAAALGIAAADLVLTGLTATGVTALIAAWPPSFDLLRYAGALYLLWLAWQAVRSPGTTAIPGAQPASRARIFRMAMLNSLLNPKPLLFFMVFLPQFVDASRGSVALQVVVLGSVLSLVALLFNAALGASSGRIAGLLQNGKTARSRSWLLAAVLVALAARLLVAERPADSLTGVRPT